LSTLELHLDYETRSEADLQKIGAFEYSVHPTTKILCVAWCLSTKENLLKTPVQVWSPAFESDYGELIRALLDPEIPIVAHNAGFEQVITRNVLTRIINRPYLKEIPVSRWVCTMALTSSVGLPRSLEKAAEALKLPVQKDMEGRRLLLKYCKPRKPTINNPAKWHRKASDLKRLMEYCRKDVETEKHLYLKIPALSPTERRIWELDQRINDRGFKVDLELIDRILKGIESESVRLDKEFKELTLGELESTRHRDKLLAWINEREVKLPDLRSDTVLKAIEDEALDPGVRRALEIRRDLSKTSTAKYQAIRNRTGHDGNVRGSLVYHAANTGRWAGSGVQPQNFPKGNLTDSEGHALDTDKVIDDLKTCDLDTIRMLYGNPFNVFSSCLRGSIIPKDKKEFFCADYASIEPRVLFWLAEDKEGIDAYENNEDIYVLMASDIYGKDPKGITKTERFLGKSAILGCGYGMGPDKFLLTCKSQGQDIDEELARKAVSAYRNLHHPVTRFWNSLERAAIMAVKNLDKKFTKNNTTWFMKGKFLCCRLPSGRLLSYFRPKIEMKKTSWGEEKETLRYFSMNSQTRQWGKTYTYGGKLVENVVQATARDFMANAMLELDTKGYEIVLTVHDEILVEKDIGAGTLKEFLEIMETVPPWGKGCPIKVEGWKCQYQVFSSS